MKYGILTIIIAMAVPAMFAHAQQPQDNWYLEATWTKSMAITNGGLSNSYGLAVGPDQRIYIGDAGSKRIQVYLPDGTYSFAITNGFGGGNGFGTPKGMITDKSGILYVADSGSNCVYVFEAEGAFIRKIGGESGNGPGQLSGAEDVAVSRAGDVYVLETNNSRVSVFSSSGIFIRTWGQAGSLSGQLDSPVSLAITPDDTVLITQCPASPTGQYLKAFTTNGVWRWNREYMLSQDIYLISQLVHGPVSVRVDDSGIIHLIMAGHYAYGGQSSDPYHTNNKYSFWYAIDPADFVTLNPALTNLAISSHAYVDNALKGSHHAVGPDGSMFFCSRTLKTVLIYRRVFRDNWVPPRNAIPMPALLQQNQRPNSSMVDIDYRVADADDTNVITAVLVFRNGNQAISNCLRNLTLVEGTATNLGAGIAANEPHRITWDAGMDWGVSLGNYRVAILAKDSRTNLLDIHYLRLPAGNGLPALTISRSPLNSNDYMQVWWWLLATNDTTIGNSSNQIVGVGGSYNGIELCNGNFTTPAGRNFIHARMNVREATPTEVAWARQAALPGNTNQFTAVSVGARPIAVNEYGFDTGDWGTNAFWVVPLN